MLVLLLLMFRRSWTSVTPTSFAICFSLPILSDTTNVDVDVRLFDQAISKSLDIIAPKKQKKTRLIIKPSLWFTASLTVDKRAARQAERKWRQSRSSEDRARYLLLHKLYLTNITLAKKKFLGDRIQQAGNSQKELYNIVKEFTTPEVNHLNIVISQSWVNKIASYFVDKINIIYSSLSSHVSNTVRDPSNPHSAPDGPSFRSFPVLTTAEIASVLGRIKSGAPNDIVPAYVLNLLSSVLLPSLTDLLNKSLQQSQFPSCWKLATVKPIIKKSYPGSPAT